MNVERWGMKNKALQAHLNQGCTASLALDSVFLIIPLCGREASCSAAPPPLPTVRNIFEQFQFSTCQSVLVKVTLTPLFEISMQFRPLFYC